MSDSILLTALNTDTATTSGALPIGTVVHGYGRHISLAGNVINIHGSGYYHVLGEFSFVVDATGPAVFSLVVDGTVVSRATVQATATVPISVTIPWIVLNRCGCAERSVSFTVDVPGTIQNAVVEVFKI